MKSLQKFDVEKNALLRMHPDTQFSLKSMALTVVQVISQTTGCAIETGIYCRLTLCLKLSRHLAGGIPF